MYYGMSVTLCACVVLMCFCEDTGKLLLQIDVNKYNIILSIHFSEMDVLLRPNTQQFSSEVPLVHGKTSVTCKLKTQEIHTVGVKSISFIFSHSYGCD